MTQKRSNLLIFGGALLSFVVGAAGMELTRWVFEPSVRISHYWLCLPAITSIGYVIVGFAPVPKKGVLNICQSGVLVVLFIISLGTPSILYGAYDLEHHAPREISFLE